MVLSTLTEYEMAEDFDLELRSRTTAARSQPNRSSTRYNTQRRYAKRRPNSTRSGMNRRSHKVSSRS